MNKTFCDQCQEDCTKSYGSVHISVHWSSGSTTEVVRSLEFCEQCLSTLLKNGVTVIADPKPPINKLS